MGRRQLAGWGQPPTGWSPMPGWAPLVDPSPRSLHAARTLGRWWWPILTTGGFLAVVVQVLDHDDPAPGLSIHGLLTIALAAAVVVLLTLHRRNGPWWLARAVAEYTVVALLAVLLSAVGGVVDQRAADHATPTTAGQAEATPAATPKTEAAAGDHRPTVLRAGAKVVRAVTGTARALAGAARWLVDLWDKAGQRADAAKGEAMAAPPPSPAPPTWRFGS